MKKIFSAFIIALLAGVLCINTIAVSASENTNIKEGLQSQTEKLNPDAKNGEETEGEKELPEKECPDGPKKPCPRPPHGDRKRQEPPRYGNAVPAPIEVGTVNAKAAFLMDFSSGKVLFGQREREHYPIASMCKIMSLLLICENMEQGAYTEDTVITVSENASGMGGSQVFLETNGNYTVSDLIKSIVVASANDATVAMAEHIAGSESGFVTLMNKRAAELTMSDTNFVNCTGLPQSGQYCCARDCAIMLKQLLTHKEYYKYSRIWMDKIPHSGGRVTEISNTNKLVRFYKGCDGGKTGYTSEAKHCVSVTAEREGMRLISVIIGADNSKTRFAEASKLLNFGFANYASRQLVFAGKPLEVSLNVKGGKAKSIELAAAEDYSVLSGKFEKINFALDYTLPQSIGAPVKKGDVVGKLSVIIDNEVVKEIDVLACADVVENTYGDCLNDIIGNW